VSRFPDARAARLAALTWGGFALGCGSAFATSFPATALVPAAILGIGCALVVAAVKVPNRLPAGIMAAGLVLGLARGSMAVPAPGAGTVDGNFGTRPVVVLGTVRSSDPGSGTSAIVDAGHISDADTDRTVSGGLLVRGPLVPALSPGDQVEIDAAGLHPLDRRPGPNSEATLERAGVEGQAQSPQVFVLSEGGPSPGRVVASVQGTLSVAVNSEVAEPEAALLLGVAFGIRQPLTPEVRQPLQDAGLIHIVVVSGLKIVLVLGLIGALARRCEWSRRRTVLLAFLVIGSYVLVSGAGPAAVRSSLMAATAMVTATGGRRTDPVALLALAAALMLGLAPSLVEDPGFQLSFLGTAGILLLAAPIASRLPGPRLVAEPFAMTVAAQLATVPVMAGTFGVVAFTGPVANALVLPLLPPMIILGGSGAVLSSVVPGLGWLPLQLTGLATSVITGIARLMTAVPGATLQVSSWPAAWTAAEAIGLIAALTAGVVLARGQRAVAR
jgi:ComEC/Rec2-related protein